MAERIDGDMHLRTFLALIPIVGGTRAALRRTLQGAAIKDSRRRLGGFGGQHPQQFAQVMSQGLKAASGDPPLRLLVNNRRRWKIVRDHAPRTSYPDHVAHGVEDRAQTVL